MIDVGVAEARVHAQPECVPHDVVGAGEVAGHTLRLPVVGRLPEQVATEELAGADLLFVEMADEVAAGELCRRADREREAKPAGA